MAVDHSTLTIGGTRMKRTAMDATAGNAAVVTAPAWAQEVEVYFTDSGGTAEAGKIADSATDGDAIGNDYFPVPSGQGYSYQLKADGESGQVGNPTYALAGTSNAGYCHVAYKRGRLA